MCSIFSKSLIRLIIPSIRKEIQPFFKIALGRELWNVVDVVVGIGLLYTLYAAGKKEK